MHSIKIISTFCSVEKAYSETIQLDEFCQKLHLISGIEPIDMKLLLRPIDITKGNDVIIFKEIKATLSNFDITKYSKVEIIDTNENSMINQLQNDKQANEVTNIDTPTTDHLMTDFQYQQRNDSALKWKMKQKLGRFDPNFKATKLSLQNEHIKDLNLNGKCQINIADNQNNGNGLKRIGYLRYIGPIPEIKSIQNSITTNSDDNVTIWCGVEFSTPIGKNDGSIKGKYYFGPVNANHGSFVNALSVSMLTEVELNSDDDDDDDEI